MSPAASDNLQPLYQRAAEDLKKNPGQWKAYESIGNCVVLAGPGSGKTKLLTIKMARTIHERIHPPQGIACLTYSTECARELKRRLDRLGIEERRNIFIGTVHGFCLNHIVRPYAKLAGYSLPDPLRVVDEETGSRIFASALVDADITDDPITWKVSFDCYRRTFLDRNSEEFKNTNKVLSTAVLAYEARLHDAGFIDFDDMVLIGLQLIENHCWIGKALKARFPVLVIDEYQDLGVPLHHIVLDLAFKTGIEIFAVGDPDQSIYSFTGAQPKLLRELAQDKRIEKVDLSLNYRCGKKIIKNSEVILGETRDYQSVSEEEGEIYFWEYQNGVKEQAEKIITEIIPMSLSQKPGRNLGDIAVLYVDRYDAAHITSAAKRNGVSYTGGDRNISYKQSPVTRWIEDCAAWCSGGWKEGTPKLSMLVSFWLNLDENSTSRLAEMIFRRQIVKYLWNSRNPTQVLKDWVDGFIGLGLLEKLEKAKTRTDECDSLKGLLRALSKPDLLGSFTIQRFGKLRGSPDHLNLITLHSSKGLEFDVVIMMGLEEGRIPSYRATTKELLHEERRKFYVGLTRAKREVHLVYSGWYQAGYRAFINGPSSFVLELGRDFIGTEVTYEDL